MWWSVRRRRVRAVGACDDVGAACNTWAAGDGQARRRACVLWGAGTCVINVVECVTGAVRACDVGATCNHGQVCVLGGRVGG